MTGKIETARPPLQGVVVPKDNRSSKEHVQDSCFEGLIRDYTEEQDWAMVEMITALYGRVLTDREKGTPDV